MRKSNLRALCMSAMIGVAGITGTVGAVANVGMTVAYASDKAVTKVTLRVDSKLKPGDTLPSISYNNSGESTSVGDGEIVVSNTSDTYSIVDAEWTTSTSKVMEVGQQPQMKLTLRPNSVGGDQYQFKGTYRSSNVSIRKADFVSASKSGGDLIVKVKVRAVEGTFSAPDNAYWKDNSKGTARWDEPEDGGTGRYEVELRRGSSKVYSTETNNRSFNFYPYMTKKGTYTFRVRTIAKTTKEKDYGDKSDWVESDEIYLAEEDVSDGSGQESGSTITAGGPGTSNTPGGNINVGWRQSGGNWYFYYPDGSYQKNGWSMIGGSWYLFNSSGQMLTGWQTINGQTYYLSDSGAMLTGWIQWGGRWYYLNTTPDQYQGALVKGRWWTVNGKACYLGADGARATGWTQVDGNWYYFYPDSGARAENTYVDSFYVDQNGVWVH
ncbi:N-acetylmuramoyl-L-alanine amidase family protein [Brotaphodocola catenula]|uniref:N-acetylmuramoyl-L-alanine amidase family protein n=1 Tax=Brotaphodocola catenula TaxID=2885361 RepID=A0AAE3DK26_9FIRM|nr:N-acetylmuramoyl-L-alanine amidase family protein [Brotaphodocola catenula]MCC2164869.1 N-acetylmuramoyl-L-alanine amidase family protein [Brotaphodocola catenula]